jgi:hypothetical protein
VSEGSRLAAENGGLRRGEAGGGGGRLIRESPEATAAPAQAPAQALRATKRRSLGMAHNYWPELPSEDISIQA